MSYTYSKKQREWLGDRYVGLAAFELLVAEGVCPKTVFSWLNPLVSNRNLIDGDGLERQIGDCYLRDGHEAALKQAKAVIQQTAHWASFRRWRLQVEVRKEENERSVEAQGPGSEPGMAGNP